MSNLEQENKQPEVAVTEMTSDEKDEILEELGLDEEDLDGLAFGMIAQPTIAPLVLTAVIVALVLIFREKILSLVAKLLPFLNV